MTFNKRFTFSIVLLLAISFGNLKAQNQGLKPGFDKTEYIEMLKIAASVADTPWVKTKWIPENYKLYYRSPVSGLENRWDLWGDGKNTIVISIRGTTPSPVSWLENFYAAMVPAKGSLKLNNHLTFNYNLSDNPRASVHVGWLMATGFMAQGMLSKIDSSYQKGYKNIIITGHSQGGAIAFLVTAYLRKLQQKNELPSDICFKTYCSAAPKPGNLYFAYDYENSTAGGWACNVVNSADWVPETPLSIQTIRDFNTLNPFVNAKKTIRKQSFPKRLAMSYAYGKLKRPSSRAVKNYRKYLGKMAGKFVNKSLPEFEAPEYQYANNYVRTGNTIVLFADEEYYLKYPDHQDNVFIHHSAGAYLYLTNKLEK
ncbi:MAG: lipase family protein [Lentimicrobiaceae bacterium]|nr:lipase family protein [Lentimicrobiaceae bacterium]MCB9024303.1 lipase family protein [Lentimicrobiaceae bacterium]MCO5264732.1 lipase family protein [Lentimicrobium sp.]HPG33947.1 lipase family protein [Lentimicrobium sp.]